MRVAQTIIAMPPRGEPASGLPDVCVGRLLSEQAGQRLVLNDVTSRVRCGRCV